MFSAAFKTQCALFICALAALSTTTTTAKAGVIGGKVTRIGLSAASTTLAFVEFSAPVGQNACTVPPGSPGAARMFFDFTTIRGKALMSLLTAAQLSSKTVSGSGNGVCITQQVAPFEAATVAESLNSLIVG